MRQAPIMLAGAMMFAILITQAVAAPFVLFPKAKELASPDGRFVVRNAERKSAPNEFVGTSLSLWLVEKATGRARKLCDYIGVAAVAWSNSDFLVVTEYVGRRTSRALVFSAEDAIDPVVLDKRTLLQLIPVGLRATLRENDHVFVEASRVAEQTLHLRVWDTGSMIPAVSAGTANTLFVKVRFPVVMTSLRTTSAVRHETEDAAERFG